MHVEIVDNRRLVTLDVLLQGLAEADDVRMAVAYITNRGLDLLWDALAGVVRRGGCVEIVTAMDGRITEPQALIRLFEATSEFSRIRLFCYSVIGSDETYHPKMYLQTYHPKMYLLSGDSQTSCLIGSSNLTTGGLVRNLEINILLIGAREEKPITQVYEIFARLKFAPGRFVPTRELLERYTQFWRLNRSARNEQVRHAASELRQAIETCRVPVPSSADLVGWLRTVYEVLPEGEFTNSDVYQHEDYFRSLYPSNQNIRAKVRQQLQILRDMGLVEHIGRGRWRKTDRRPQ